MLMQGVEVWNKWRDEHRDIQPDLVGANLANADLSGANLKDANLFFRQPTGSRPEVGPPLKGQFIRIESERGQTVSRRSQHGQFRAR